MKSSVWFSLIAVALLLTTPSCSKKVEGCKLDSECPNGMICRNLNCVADQANSVQNNIADENNTDNAESAPSNSDSDKTDETKALGLSEDFIQKTTKLSDRGLDVDYVLDHEIYLDENKVLEIEPGVTIDMVSADARFFIRGDAVLKIMGSADNPVVLKSSTNASWGGILFETTHKDNQLHYLTMLNVEGEDGAIHLINEARPSIEHVTIDGAVIGVVMDIDARPGKFESNTIKNSKKYPLVLRNMAQIPSIAQNNVFENNALAYIRIEASELFPEQSFTFPKHAIPYLMTEGLWTNGNSGEIIIPAGCDFAFEHGKNFDIREGMLLKIQGTSDAPVVMRGSNDEDQFWNGINLQSNRPNEISNLIIKNVGNDDSSSLSLRDGTKIKLSNISFKTNPNHCIRIENNVNITNGGGHTFDACGKSNIFDERIDGDDDVKMLKELPEPVSP